MTRSRDVADTQDNLGGAVSPVTAGKNIVINGGFDIWQRGTSIATTGGQTADRWTTFTDSATRTVSRQVTGDTTNLPFIQYAGRFQRASGNTSTGRLLMGQSIESFNSIPFASRTVTFSFYARRGANYSSTSNALGVYCASGTGTDQNIFVGFTGQTPVINTAVTLTTTWQRFTTTGAVGATATQLGFYFGYTPTGTAGADDWFEVTGVQIELGSAATPFARAGGTLQGELTACQRYYRRFTATANNQQFSAFGASVSTTQAYIAFPVSTTMRVNPTSVDYSNLQITNWQSGGTVTSVSISRSNDNLVNVLATVASGLTAGSGYCIADNNVGSAFIGFSAEF